MKSYVTPDYLLNVLRSTCEDSNELRNVLSVLNSKGFKSDFGSSEVAKRCLEDGLSCNARFAYSIFNDLEAHKDATDDIKNQAHDILDEITSN